MSRQPCPRLVRSIAYTTFDPSGCAFPQPRVPLLPVLTRGSLRRPFRSRGTAPLTASRPRRWYTRGRYALFDAYRLSGVGAHGSLLAPAYHCRTMLDPAISLGASIGLYPLDEALAPDLASLRQLVRGGPQPVRALLLTHFFGFAQAAAPIRALCDEHGIALIEDCSHALFDPRGGGELGRHGCYTTASPYKLFPCEDGGWLIPAPGAPLPEAENRRAGLRAELKSLANAIERSVKRPRAESGMGAPDAIDAEIRQIVAAPIERGPHLRSESEAVSGLYRESEQDCAGSRVSRWLISLCDIDRIAAQRRANYRRWRDAVGQLPHCRPLFAELPDSCVPYMFPLLIDHPHTHFHVLKKLGVPIGRWDDTADSTCPVSRRYRDHLLHLPCHQALSEHDLDWMMGVVSKVMRGVPTMGSNDEP